MKVLPILVVIVTVAIAGCTGQGDESKDDIKTATKEFTHAHTTFINSTYLLVDDASSYSAAVDKISAYKSDEENIKILEEAKNALEKFEKDVETSKKLHLDVLEKLDTLASLVVEEEDKNKIRQFLDVYVLYGKSMDSYGSGVLYGKAYIDAFSSYIKTGSEEDMATAITGEEFFSGRIADGDKYLTEGGRKQISISTMSEET